MCMACEEAEMFYRWQLLQQIAKGEMPAGLSTEDLVAMDMPLPGEIEMVEDGDRIIIRKVEKDGEAAKPAGAFVCDTPDDQ